MKLFDPDNAVDAIAHVAKNAIADASMAVILSRPYAEASLDDQVQGLVSGMMVGAMGALIAAMKPGAEAELRAILREHLPYWFDRALEINDRPTLGDIQ
jgi:hypothetical protein